MASFPTATDSTTTTTPLRPPEQGGLKCPRCDSPNTKFCYFNNYSLTQPRHFCKTCRRYWTKGGALRNVPVGGGCRKNKKKSSGSGSTSSSSSSSRIHLDPFDPTLPDPAAGGLLFNGISPAPPSMEFQLGLLPFYGGTSTGMGFNYPLASGVYNELGGSGSCSSPAVNCNTLASSIESLSSINQDLHLKLQQQRMSMFFGGGGAQKESSLPALPAPLLHDQQQQEPMSFQVTDAEVDRKGTDATTAWFLETPSIMPFANPSNNNTGNWGGGFQAWNGMQQFNSS